MKPKFSPRSLVCAFVFLSAGIAPAWSQCASIVSATPRRLVPLVAIGSAAADSAILGSLIGSCWGKSSLIRSSIPGKLDSGGTAIEVLEPSTVSVWNSRIPNSINDGALWAGRGWNHLVTAGARLRTARMTLTLAPQLAVSENMLFPILPSPDAARSAFSSPFHSGRFSADLPLRFGNASYSRVLPGETGLDVPIGRASIGVTSASMWWGPALENPLVMSNNASGVPQLYARTRRPVRSPIGEFEAHWLLGMLTESPFFDRDARNDQRSLNAAVVTLRLAADTALTIGGARAVYGRAGNFGGLFAHSGDVLFRWTRPSTHVVQGSIDQIFSLFAQWRFPGSGFETHAEIAWLRTPASLRDFIVAPQENQGYTLGLQWSSTAARETRVRLRSEVTMLELTPEAPGAEIPEFYASNVVPQGYTQQGQVIGAAIGPSSSSQMLGLDVFHSRWKWTGVLGRIRWEDNAFYRAFPARVSHYGHDVSIYATMGLAWDARWMAIDASATRTIRMSFLFRTIDPFDRNETAFDVRNTTLRLRLIPHY